jgi:hypothetical protein
MAGYVRPNVGYGHHVDGMPDVPSLLPAQDAEGGSDCDFEVCVHVFLCVYMSLNVHA